MTANIRNLLNFQAPAEGEVTLCVLEGRVHSMNYEFANINVFTNIVENYPNIFIARDILNVIRTNDEGRALFLSVDVPFLKQLIQIYYEQGFMEVLNFVAREDKYLITTSAKIILKLIDYADNIRIMFNPALKECGMELINEISPSRNWFRDPVRCISWHRDYTKLAVATCDDSVRIYSKHMSLVPLLKCKQQKNITSIAWRPMSDSDIAVACENVVIIWNVDPNSVVSRPSASSAIIIQRPGHQPIVSIAWSPLGDVLATAAARDSAILIWDVELDRTSSLKRPGSSGNTLLRWSPTRDKMFSATNSVVFRVWECRAWQSERWNVLSGRVQAACWSPCGLVLLFATNEEPLIYALSFIKSDLIFTTDSSNSPNLAVPLYDVAKVDIDGVIVGGIIQNMDWDPTGNHLAIIFQDTNYVAIFSVIFKPTLQLSPSCLVAGTPEETPSVIEFQKDFCDGSCLTIAWSSGRVQYFPIVYSINVTNPVGMNRSLYNC